MHATSNFSNFSMWPSISLLVRPVLGTPLSLWAKTPHLSQSHASLNEQQHWMSHKGVRIQGVRVQCSEDEKTTWRVHNEKVLRDEGQRLWGGSHVETTSLLTIGRCLFCTYRPAPGPRPSSSHSIRSYQYLPSRPRKLPTSQLTPSCDYSSTYTPSRIHRISSLPF